MVSRYSKKRAKYTYAERVLGALSEIQKEHRKHAVHMATLRAHVRKMADARKDKMGPQWSQWVSRTVNRLADDGILDTSDAHGNISFTPNAKKTITKVRRESMGPGVVASPGLERKIWKDVTRRMSGVGVKRRRRSSAASGHTYNNGEWEDSETPPRKKQARKSLSRMTKSELEDALREAMEKLQVTQELQPANAEELSMLQEELSDREREVAALREELTRLKEQPQTDDRCVTVGLPTRMVTPPPTNPSLPSSLGRDAGMRSRLPIHGVIRTLSGSLISNLSKQPTPEPSDEGSQDGGDDDGDESAFEDSMQDVSMSAFPELQSFPRPQQALGLATPQSSPLMADQDDFEQDDYSRDTIREHEEHGDGSSDQMVQVRDELESQSAELQRLREENERLLSERDELHASVASRDDRIQRLEAAAASQDEAREALARSLSAEVARRCELQAVLEASESAVASEREKVAVLEAERDHLQGKLSQRDTHLSSLTEELQAARRDASQLLTTRRENEAKLKESVAESAHANELLGKLHRESQNLAEVLETTNDQLGIRTSELEQTKALLTNTQNDLAKATLALEAAGASQETMSARIAELERDLEDAREQTRVLHIAKNALEETSGNLQETVEQLREDLSHAKAQLESTRTEVQQSQEAIRDLRASHAQALAEASSTAEALAASKESVSELELAVDTLRSQVQESAAEAAELRKSLETEQASRRIAESEVVSTKASRDKLLSDLADKTARLSSATEELEQARLAESEVRRQLRALEEEYASERAARAAERSGLQDALEVARKKAAELDVEVGRLNSRLSATLEEMSSTVSAKDEIEAELRKTRADAASLQEELDLAQGDIREAEEEIEELRLAKAEDERSIQSLKAGLAKLRQLQMDALNEVDSKMISAHTAPTPGSRRRSSIAPRLSVGRRA